MRAAGARMRRGFERHFRLLTTTATFIVGTAVTINAWHGADVAVDTAARQRFEARVAEKREAIRGRMIDYAQVLRGGVGVFAVTREVDRAEWHRYVDSLRIELAYPGIQALGVIFRVPAAALAAHEHAMRNEGFHDYSVKPPGERAEYAPIVYIEPPSQSNRTMGFDMYSERTRRAAIQRSRDTGEPAISGKVVLQQETPSDAQTGFLMFLPIYRNAAPADRIEERRNNTIGFVYAPFRTRDLMRGLLREVPDLRLEIFDGFMPDAAGLLYDSGAANAPRVHKAAFSSTSQLIVQDRVWTLRSTSLPGFENAIDRTRPNATLAAGLAICLMLTGLVWALATVRGRALLLAQTMTSELRESQERLSLAIEGSNLALFDYDVRTGQVTLSERWNVMLGGPPESRSTTMAALEALVHPDDVPRLRQNLMLTLQGAVPFYHVEHRVRAHDGTWKWISSHAKVVQRDADGSACRMTGTNADVSERKAVDDLKNEFIATVSHELRTPLTSLIGSLELLKEEYAADAPPDARTFLDIAHQNGERLAALVNQILDLEKLAAGKIHLRRQRIMLDAFLKQGIALNAAYAEQHGTRYVLEPVDPEVSLIADHERLMQVFTNLLSNAAKYSPPGEPVTVRAVVSSDRARIEVCDRGPGVPPEFRERIFAKFAQADASGGHGKGGTGLGLAISKSIIEAMQGSIGYDSTRQMGATFYFEVPLREVMDGADSRATSGVEASRP